MIGLDVLGMSQRPFLSHWFPASNQADALRLIILNNSDSWTAENYFRGSLIESQADWRIELDLLCRLSLAVNLIQIHRNDYYEAGHACGSGVGCSNV
jgi:hypothetical protein